MEYSKKITSNEYLPGGKRCAEIIKEVKYKMVPG
jgi:hypothetical protein